MFSFCFRALSTQQGGYVHATNLYYYYYYYQTALLSALHASLSIHIHLLFPKDNTETVPSLALPHSGTPCLHPVSPPICNLPQFKRIFSVTCIVYFSFCISHLGLWYFCQDLEIRCPNLLEISKRGVQIVHLQYFYM